MATPTALNPTSGEGRGVAAHPTIQFLTGTAERAFEDESATARRQVEGVDRRAFRLRRSKAFLIAQMCAPKREQSAVAQSREVMPIEAFQSRRRVML